MNDRNIAIIADSCKIDNRKLGNYVSADFPGLSFQTADVSGSGLLGTLAVPIMGQLDSTEVTIHVRGLNRDTSILYEPGKHKLEFLHSQQLFSPNRDDKGVAGKVYVEGRLKSVEGGSSEVPNPVEVSATYEATRIQAFEDGKEILLIDKENGIYKVNGKDYMAAVMAAVK